MAANSISDDRKGAPPFSLKKSVVEFVIVALIAAGAGVLLSTLNPPPTPPPEASAMNAANRGAPNKEGVCAAAASHIFDLPPVVSNLGAPVDAFIRVEASIVIDPKTTPHPEILGGEIATDELAYLRTLTLPEIQGPIGLANLRQDLSDRAITRSGGKVSEYILRTLVVQ